MWFFLESPCTASPQVPGQRAHRCQLRGNHLETRTLKLQIKRWQVERLATEFSVKWTLAFGGMSPSRVGRGQISHLPQEKASAWNSDGSEAVSAAAADDGSEAGRTRRRERIRLGRELCSSDAQRLLSAPLDVYVYHLFSRFFAIFRWPIYGYTKYIHMCTQYASCTF